MKREAFATTCEFIECPDTVISLSLYCINFTVLWKKNNIDLQLNEQTFVRQKVTLASHVSPTHTIRAGITNTPEVKVLYKTTPTSDGVHYTECCRKSTELVKFSEMESYCFHFSGCLHNNDGQTNELANTSKGTWGTNCKCLFSVGNFRLPKQLDSNDKSNSKLNSINFKEHKLNSSQIDTCSLSSPKSVHSPTKINSSSAKAGAGALRYALHLRFLCPPSRKSLRSIPRCKSVPSSVQGSSNVDGDRRFYLYNDLRVVFPQRLSDADEGEV